MWYTIFAWFAGFFLLTVAAAFLVWPMYSKARLKDEILQQFNDLRVWCEGRAVSDAAVRGAYERLIGLIDGVNSVSLVQLATFEETPDLPKFWLASTGNADLDTKFKEIRNWQRERLTRFVLAGCVSGFVVCMPWCDKQAAADRAHSLVTQYIDGDWPLQMRTIRDEMASLSWPTPTL